MHSGGYAGCRPRDRPVIADTDGDAPAGRALTPAESAPAGPPAATLQSGGAAMSADTSWRRAVAEEHGATPASRALERAAAVLGDAQSVRTRLAQRSLLILFAGAERPGDLGHAFEDCGWRVLAVDTKRGGASHNLLRPAVSSRLLEDVRAQCYDVVWLGTPCESFSVWKTDASHPSLRTRAHPHGDPACPTAWSAYLTKHNMFVQLSVDFARAAWEVGASYVVENPADRGDRASPLFSSAFREHAPLWLMPNVRALSLETSAALATFPQCAVGSPFQKWTSILFGGPATHALHSLSALECKHPRHAKTAKGYDEFGGSNAEAAGRYPAGMCSLVARLMSDLGAEPEGAQAVEPLAADGATAGQPACQQAGAGDQQPSWRALPSDIPAHWPEATFVTGPALETARHAEIGYVSRRRAEAESDEVLARAPLPERAREVALPARPEPRLQAWPEGAPPRPIHISQLFNDGVYAQVQAALAQVVGGLQTAERAAAEGRRPSTIPAVPVAVFESEATQPVWARQCVWDTEDFSDCKPLQPFTSDDPPVQRVVREFFARWGEELQWKDKDMLQRVSVTGCDSLSTCSRDTVIFGHHKGLREEYLPAREDVEQSTRKGWVTQGSPHLRTVPARMPPKNVVEQLKWKMREDGTLYKKQKWRVTTDDTIAPAGQASRNTGISAGDISNVPLPRLSEFAEAVAVLRAVAADMRIEGGVSAMQRVTMWALDLSNAYRELAAARSEWWLQCFVWFDGVRLDKRCVFGTAHLVDLFERVTSFVLEVARRRIQQYDTQHPYSVARQRWLQWRVQQGLPNTCTYSDIYLDDGYGATCDEGCPDGGERSRVHLAIVQATFQEAGWDIAVEKVQLGPRIELLGQVVATEGAGEVAVQELRRQGLLLDIAEQLRPDADDDAVSRAAVEKLVGRLGYIAQVVKEGNAYLQPLFRLEKVTFWQSVRQSTFATKARRCKVRVKPRRINVRGPSAAQREYRAALRWWEVLLQEPVHVPLAPRKEFPTLGDPGCVFVFTDAAREDGTGFGGFTFVQRNDNAPPSCLYVTELWSDDVRQALQCDRVSMPAGEAFGAVALIDCVLDVLQDATHAICFTDSSATARGLTVGGSGSPQLNVILRWLFDRHPRVQFLGVHIPGVLNVTSDNLSRGRPEEALADIRQTGARLCRLRPCAEAVGVLLPRVQAAERRDD